MASISVILPLFVCFLPPKLGNSSSIKASPLSSFALQFMVIFNPDILAESKMRVKPSEPSEPLINTDFPDCTDLILNFQFSEISALSDNQWF
jgi:hypothetical protein